MKKLSFFASLGLCSVTVFGQAGTLDPTFATGGKYTPSQSFYLSGKCVLQSDEKIIAVGTDTSGGVLRYYAARYMPDGGTDITFGTNGVGYMLPVVASEGYITAATVQADNKIVVAGVTVSAVQKLIVARFNADGSIDSTFAGAGNMTLSLSENADLVTAVKMLPNGNIIVAGGSGLNDLGHSPFTVQLLPDGTPDNTYGTNGINVINDMGYSVFINDLAIQTDGKAVAVLNHRNLATISQFYVLRLNTNGTRDNTFGTSGLVQTMLTNSAASQTLNIQADGKIVAGGAEYYNGSNQWRLAMARYLTDGTPDNSFGTGGKVAISHTYTLEINDVSLKEQADHKLVLAASSKSAANAKADFIIARFNPDGTTDNGFGNGGYVLTDFDTQRNNSGNLYILNSGKILVTGISYTAFNAYHTVMARYNSCGISFTSQPANATWTEGNTAQFTVSTPSTTAMYQWQKETTTTWESITDGGQYSGTQTNTLTIANLTLANDEQRYRCLVFTGNCTDTSMAATLSVEDGTSILEAAASNGFKIFPNPAKDKLQVTFASKPQDIAYTITDPTGRKVLSGKLSGTKNTISIAGITAGIYFLNMEHLGTLKFIKN